MSIAILGTGPAGLLVAHAARQFGVDFRLFSSGGRSDLFGAQYLHQTIPGIPDLPMTRVEHKFVGHIDDYRRKVYGTEWDGVVSPEQYSGTTYAFDIRAAYEWLWFEYGRSATHLLVKGGNVETVFGDVIPLESWSREFPLVISTIPRPSLCVNPDHTFKSAKIFCVGDAPEAGIKVPVPSPDDTIICSGDPTNSWYRTSRIFGYSTVEWSATGKKRPPISGVAEVSKPTSTDCTCQDHILKLGRYGEWKKGVLVHHVYRAAVLAFRESVDADTKRFK